MVGAETSVSSPPLFSFLSVSLRWTSVASTLLSSFYFYQWELRQVQQVVVTPLFKKVLYCFFSTSFLGLLPRDAALDGAVVVVVSKAESPSSTTTIIVPLVPLVVEPRIHTARFSAGLSSWCPDSAPFAHSWKSERVKKDKQHLSNTIKTYIDRERVTVVVVVPVGNLPTQWAHLKCLKWS